jgi:hypothetical protein
MKIRFTNFWSTFDHSNNFFFRYLQENGHNPVVVQDEKIFVDMEFVSVFPSYKERIVKKIEFQGNRVLPSRLSESLGRLAGGRAPLRNSKIRIWYSGENIRPPLTEDFDGFLSFDQLKFNSNSIYFPLWMTHLNWFGEFEQNDRLGGKVSASNLLVGRELLREKKKLAIIFLSNPHPFRLQVIKELSSLGEVDVFGSYSGKVVKSKVDVARDYKYSICFENDLYPGYVTEKLLEAYLSETVPLYWGDLGDDTYYNKKSFINLKDFESTRDWIAAIRDHDYEATYEMSLLVNHPTLDDFENFMQNLLDKI